MKRGASGGGGELAINRAQLALDARGLGRIAEGLEERQRGVTRAEGGGARITGGERAVEALADRGVAALEARGVDRERRRRRRGRRAGPGIGGALGQARGIAGAATRRFRGAALAGARTGLAPRPGSRGLLRAITGSIDCEGGEGGRDAIEGGPGGVGRVRIDAATLAGVPGPLVDDLVRSGVPYRGASFAIETPLVVTAATLDVQVVGPPQEMLVLDVPGGARTVMTDAAGSARFMAVPVPPGLHRLCVTVAGTPLDPFGRSCLDLAAP